MTNVMKYIQTRRPSAVGSMEASFCFFGEKLHAPQEKRKRNRSRSNGYKWKNMIN